ncbi:hypothetical protein BABINDRAFT_7843 [Babjeviella inositovora NRRL Y-12698]|uniref:Uncharacterized protein n=1 Tax=Babjeviella inositovora NRRL Y-12698 TaxID=984486 RepID=A0A1E3QRT5_9ASCO|nr:uncharacterized protein BABINDRAFT_7843 [Babjeviella inositovora NRRL Y-12698]ODQ80409.1 hypothetical protein BABINDRAFT_7843 [Babjeviella inositovora NRRL Y-12698]
MKQIQFPRTKCHVTCGDVVSEKLTKPERSLVKHNLSCRVQLLLPEASFQRMELQLAGLRASTFQMTIPSLNALLSPGFIALVAAHRLCVVSEGHVDHEDMFAIVSKLSTKAVRMVLNLSELTYQRCGLMGKRSQLLSGILKQKKYQVVYADVCANDEQQQWDRLLWSSDKIFQNTKITVTCSTDETAIAETKAYLSLIGTVTHTVVGPQVQRFTSVDTPKTLSYSQHLKENPPYAESLLKDHLESYTLDLLEWLAYASVNGQQLTQEVDPYVSSYSVRDLDGTCKQNLVCVTWDGLIATDFLSFKLHQLQKGKDWSCVASYGLADTPISFGLQEHGFHENGQNDVVVLVTGDKYTLWEILGGRDGY